MKSSVGEVLPILASLEGNDFAAGVENSKNPSLHDSDLEGFDQHILVYSRG